MSTVTLLVISVLLCLQLQAFGQQPTIDELLLRSKQAEAAVQRALEEKLPPSAEARQEGAEVLATLKRGLDACDQELRSGGDIPKHFTCVSTLQGLAMASMGELAGQHWAKSGASRPTLFW